MGFLDKLRANQPEQAPATGKVTDPVCHMTIAVEDAAGQTTHAGITTYFCSGSCKKKFDAAPHKYLGAHSHE